MKKRILSGIIAVICALSLIVIPEAASAEKIKSEYNAVITVPDDAVLTLARKDFSGYNFQEFTPVMPVDESASDDESSHYYLLDDKKEYYYRVSGESYVTYTGYFSFSETKPTDIRITKDMLMPEGKDSYTVERDTSCNGGYNEADIYLNINPEGHLRLPNVGDTYRLVHLRRWQAVNSTTQNVFCEPDYSYAVYSEEGEASDAVVRVTEDGVIEAVGIGSAIVLVKYNAFSYAQSMTNAGTFYGALWPENTGVFVVTVGLDEPDFETNMTINKGRNDENVLRGKLSGDNIDSEHDVIYFEGEKTFYDFTPSDKNCVVSVANPTISDVMSFSGFCGVSKNTDGSFSVPLTEGRNIVKVSKGNLACYQVITAKKVKVYGADTPVSAGDNVSVKLDGVFHPANKLAGVYNMSACIAYTLPDNQMAGGASNQYMFASKEAAMTVDSIIEKKATGFMTSYAKKGSIRIPSDWAEDTYTLKDGGIIVLGFGDPIGNHRGITYENGKAPNLDASVKEAFLGRLPDIEIPVLHKNVTDVTVTKLPDKTSYFSGEVFDGSGMIVTATYDDLSTAEVTSYKIEDDLIKDNTKDIKVLYGGKSASVEIDVIPIEVCGIEILKAPQKTVYNAGEFADPTGMEVFALYNNNTSSRIFDYEYFPKSVLTADVEKLEIKYKGFKAEVPVSVSEAQHESTSPQNKISVKISVLGDDKHSSSYEGKIHTYKDRNLTTWVDRTTITLERGDTVCDAIEKVLSLNGIPFSNPSGDYIESIKGLSEFTNGPYSGWMYLLNGKYPEVGISEQKVKNGDVIIFHYTDDYTCESASDKFSTPKSESVSGGTETVAKVKTSDYQSIIKECLNVLYSAVKEPTVASVGGEWSVISAARSKGGIDEKFKEKYLDNALKYAADKNGILSENKYTEYSRVVLALTSLGKNPETALGYNILLPLKDFDKTVYQGTNGAIYALIALDSKNYYSDDSALREKYIDYILKMQYNDGGFGLSENSGSNIDVTAMALIALSEYKEKSEVAESIDKAFKYLSAKQDKNGLFSDGASAASESISQVITALCSLDMSVEEHFIKDGKTLVDRLCEFYIPNEGFEHIRGEGVNSMATEQALYALVSYERFKNGKNKLFDMNDVSLSDEEKTLNFGLFGKHADIKRKEAIFNVSFDDISDSGSKAEILELAKRGIVSGREKNMFFPNEYMKRAEFCAIVCKALGLEKTGEKTFSDVNAESWYFNFISCAYNYGIVNGVGENLFMPESGVKRCDAAIMVRRMCALCGFEKAYSADEIRSILSQFDDRELIPSYSAEAMAFCFDNGILSDESMNAEAEKTVDRNEMAFMIYNALRVTKLL